MPRHPPCALHSLPHTTNTTPHPTHQTHRAHTARQTPTTPRKRVAARYMHNSNCYKDARVHYEKTKHPAQQPTHPSITRKTSQTAGTRNPHHPPPPRNGSRTGARVRPQNPNSVPPHTQRPHRGPADAGVTVIVPLVSYPQPAGRHHERAPRPTAGTTTPTHGHTHAPHTGANAEHAVVLYVLLRKEVIQPHLPVRLPCYDFVPIASPTFDGSPHKGWATGFGCCRLS